MIFYKAMVNGKMSAQSLLEYLKKHSWYGITDKKDGFNWLEMISPSINSFFTQSEIDISEKKNSNQGYILCIDSLVLKFERLLREFSRKIGAQTIEIKEGGTQERISFDKLLENPKLAEIIPKDDIALFTFIFTPVHMNVRNNIAHSFYKTEHYTAGLMFLLIAAFLKLGNHTFPSA